MASDRWNRVEELLHAALGRRSADRAAFLTQACAGDDGLREEIDSLLALEASAEDFLDTPVPLETFADIDAHQSDGPAAPAVPKRIGHYHIIDKIGEGGMGVVYVATDDRLGRRVALKLLRHDSSDPRGHERLVREARVAAALSDARLCQVFELGEWAGHPFIAMELVAGTPLTSRLSTGPLPPSEAIQIALQVADALTVLHAHGIVHRDLKPSNIFITGSGIKLLDFGLARSFGSAGATASPVTHAGTIVGTPQYAAPEQLTGADVDGRADLFSLAVILFEMIAGRPPFGGRTIAALIHAVLFDAPPALAGSPAIVALDRVLHRGLAKRAEDRHSDAASMAAELRRVLPLFGDDRVTEVRRVLRLAVLPFRLLKPDPEIDYLPASVADVLVSSLSGMESLVVRSSLASARFANTRPDLSVLAAELAADVILTGSILRIKERLRVSIELVSAPAGDVLLAETMQVPVDEVFDLLEAVAGRVVAALPLTTHDQSRKLASRSSSTKAFDLYLRGMQLRMETSSWKQARAFFDQSVEIDDSFAPAWAERGRLDRVLGKYEDPGQLQRAESALMHALDVDPDNAAAHYYYAQLEIDLGRVDAALARLLRRVRERRVEPQIHAALVHACRYGGLIDASVAAHRQAHRLDPQVATSVLHTYYMQGAFDLALEAAHRSSDPVESRVLAALGRDREAIEAARREEERFSSMPLLRNFSSALRAALEGRREDALEALRPFEAFAFNDGEGLFYVAEIYARLDCCDEAIAMLERAVAAGFLCVPAYEHAPVLARLRDHARWNELMDRVRTRQRPILETFTRAGGPTLLGVRTV
jgi:serine/threonine protein kinase/tetratricopeptide (TPR) repeat protein